MPGKSFDSWPTSTIVVPNLIRGLAPTRMPNGSSLRRDVGTTMRIAREAVKSVYQRVSSPKDKTYLSQRVALAYRFRTKYGPDAEASAIALPFSSGVGYGWFPGQFPLSAALTAPVSGIERSPAALA